jgi:hypothetical protein
LNINLKEEGNSGHVFVERDGTIPLVGDERRRVPLRDGVID